MELLFDRWPGGKRRCLTLSYDDGRLEDRRLVEILDRAGVRGTFHLNTAVLGDGEHVTAEELKTLYKNHEVSAHTHTHPFLAELPQGAAVRELLENRRLLEAAVGHPVRGMSYPYGQVSDALVQTARACGMEYSRTVTARPTFEPPADFLRWDPTCHHNGLGDLWERFAAKDYRKKLQLFYLWGHSYEFANDGNWDVIEAFCARAGGRGDTWYATNIEIKDYLTALRGLVMGADGRMVLNNSRFDVWVSCDGEAVRLPAGGLVHF